VKVTVFASAESENVPGTTALVLITVSANEVVLNEIGFIGFENCTTMAELVATEVAPFTGVTLTTAGADSKEPKSKRQKNGDGLRSLTEPLQVAMDNGAKRALIPIENKRNFLEVSGDIVEKVDPIFFSDPLTAALKALGMT